MAGQGRFLTGSTMGHVVRMTMTGAIGITFVFLVDAANLLWIAQLGEPQLMAAIGYAFAIQFLSVSAGIGLMIAATALVSRAIGAGKHRLARRQAASALVVGVLVQSVVAAIIFIFRHQFVAMAGAEGGTAALAARYLALTVPSLSVMAAGMIANATLRAEGDGMRSMTVTLMSGGVALVIDPFLIIGLGWGLDGAAAGVVLSRFVMLAAALYFATQSHDLIARPRKRDCLGSVRPYLNIAIPAIITQMATPVGNYIFTSVMSQFGDEAMAGWAVVGRLTVVAFGGIFSLAGAIGGIFGQNFGARDYGRVRNTYRDAILFGLIYTLITWAVLIVASGPVSRAFALPEVAAEVLYAFTHYGAAGFVFASALFVSNSAFNATGKPRRSSVTNWVRDGILSLPLALWFATSFGAPGVIYAQAAAGALVGLAAAAWGWHYVTQLHRCGLPRVDLPAPRSYAHADRFRRR
mgnify:FL=1